MKQKFSFIVFFLLCLLCDFSLVVGKSKDNECDEDQDYLALALTSATCGMLIGGGGGLLGKFS